MVIPTSVLENDFSPGDQSDQLDRGVAIAADPMALRDLQRRPVGSTDDPERDREFLALMRRPFFAFVEHRASLGDVPELCDLGRQFLEFPVDFFGFRMGLVSKCTPGKSSDPSFSGSEARKKLPFPFLWPCICSRGLDSRRSSWRRFSRAPNPRGPGKR